MPRCDPAGVPAGSTVPAVDSPPASPASPINRRSVPPAVLGVTALGACALLVAVDPAAPGGPYPPCPFRLATGLACPGCGSLRALSHLLRGDLAGALGHNVLLIVALPFILAVAVAWVAGRPARLPATSPGRVHAPLAFLLVALVFGVARNLPWSPFSALAP